MPPLRDFLSRFRPAGAPGAATRAGIPVDRGHELEAEVGPVLALLDSTRDECDQIIGQARRDAAAIMAAARTQAAAIGEDGARRAQAARDEATRQVTDTATADAAVMVANAQREAVRIRAQAMQRMPVLVNRAVGELRRALLAADQIAGDR